MSKSKGNVIDPLELLKKYPKDLLRAYFIAKINFLQDGVCEEDLLKEFYHDFLVNNLSNLVSRTNKMLELYQERIILPSNNELKNEKLEGYQKKCETAIKEFQRKMDNYELTAAFSQVQILLADSNKLISDLAPWELAKKGNAALLNSTLNYLANGIKIIAFLLNCVIPETSHKIFDTFNLDNEKLNYDNLLDFSSLNRVKIKSLGRHLYQPIK
jgi:methionyl-tRNA synthetase